MLKSMGGGMQAFSGDGIVKPKFKSSEGLLNENPLLCSPSLCRPGLSFLGQLLGSSLQGALPRCHRRCLVTSRFIISDTSYPAFDVARVDTAEYSNSTAIDQLLGYPPTRPEPHKSTVNGRNYGSLHLQSIIQHYYCHPIHRLHLQLYIQY